jgi:hypothetical protein
MIRRGIFGGETSGLSIKDENTHGKVVVVACQYKETLGFLYIGILYINFIPGSRRKFVSLPAVVPLTLLRSGFRLYVRGNVRGDVCGDVRGDVRGNVRGDVRGNVCGDVRGDVRGNVRGDVCGDVCGASEITCAES